MRRRGKRRRDPGIGGRTLVALRGPDYMREIARRGGLARAAQARANARGAAPRVTIALSETQVRRLREVAEAMEVTLAFVLREAFDYWLAHVDKGEEIDETTVS